MPLILDQQPQTPPAALTDASTIADFLQWAQTRLPKGRILAQIHIDNQHLTGTALADARRAPLAGKTLALTSADQKELSLTMLGKLAALVEWLGPQHKEVAALLERGQTQPALVRLQGLLSAWQQVQDAYANLAKMLDLSLDQLPVRQLTGTALLEEFCRQLSEIQTALQNHDFVLLADILQYEMDGAVANWMSLLEATLGIVEPAPV